MGEANFYYFTCLNAFVIILRSCKAESTYFRLVFERKRRVTEPSAVVPPTTVGVDDIETVSYIEMFQAVLSAPVYHLILEACLILGIVTLVFRKSYRLQKRIVLTEKEKVELLAEWKPEPLVPEVDENHPDLASPLVSGKPGSVVIVDGKECVNAASLNFLGMAENKRVEKVALESISKYGVGSCGPRGFYGTVDVHLELETRLAQFMQVEEAILYSYGFATIASAIPAYAKRGDIILADEGVSYAIQKGIQASRSKVVWFRHNDVSHLKECLESEKRDDLNNPQKAKSTRRFLIVEGIYMNHGDICPLPDLVALKNEYKLRLFVEESYSFGSLGATGKGVTEHFDVDVNEVDLISASLEYSLGSIGGFCCGPSYIIDHQRLSGLGYCFSASLPPMLASAAVEALNILEETPSPVTDLQQKSIQFHGNLLNTTLKPSPTHSVSWVVGGDPLSPIKHLYIRNSKDMNRENIENSLRDVVKNCRGMGVAVTLASYLDNEAHLPLPSIRLALQASLTQAQMSKIISVL